MGRKKILEKKLGRLNKKKNDLAARALASQDATEVRSINSQIEDLNAEITETEEEIAAIDAEITETDGDEGGDPEPTPSQTAPDARGFNPLAAFNVRNVPQTGQAQENTAPTATMEYRTAFMNYVQRGQMSDVLRQQMQTRENSYTGNVAEDLGILIPQTVIQEIIKGVEKVYGQLYSRVKKTNVRGGVKYPIGSFSATFSRINEYGSGAAPTTRQKGGKITGYVEFSYLIGEIRLAKTLLESVLEVPVFERELSKVIVEAYVEAMDKEIMTGDSEDGQFEGILTEAAKGSSGRIPASNIIEFTAEDMADWTAWQKNLFAKIPLSMRALRPEFVMTANTYEANIKTLKDDNNRPVYNETFNPVDGAETASFKGKQVVFVEEDIFGNFNDIDVSEESEDSPYFGMYWIPEKAYAINSNLQFFVKRYFDDEKNEWVDKALVINDGKILDPKYLYLLKKVATEITA